jgi:uncharacterized protein (TIGR01244 family)
MPKFVGFPFRIALLVLPLLVQALPARAQADKVTKETIPGISTFARLETTVACGGATKAEAVPAIKQMGFKSIINVREANEPGAEMEAEEAAAHTVGLRFVNVPFRIADPAPDLVDRFIAAVTLPANTPAYIHCAAGGRAAALWMIKRVQVDRWDENRALEEAVALGLNDRLKPFALNYIHSHAR